MLSREWCPPNMLPLHVQSHPGFHLIQGLLTCHRLLGSHILSSTVRPIAGLISSRQLDAVARLSTTTTMDGLISSFCAVRGSDTRLVMKQIDCIITIAMGHLV